MAFDSNPQAVYHAEGYASLKQLGTATFDLNTPTALDFADADSGGVTRSTLETEGRGGMLLVEVRSGAPRPMHPILLSQVPSPDTAPDAGDAAASTNSLVLTHGATTVSIGFDAAGNLIAAGSAQSLGSTEIVIYQVH